MWDLFKVRDLTLIQNPVPHNTQKNPTLFSILIQIDLKHSAMQNPVSHIDLALILQINLIVDFSPTQMYITLLDSTESIGILENPTLDQKKSHGC